MGENNMMNDEIIKSYYRYTLDLDDQEQVTVLLENLKEAKPSEIIGLLAQDFEAFNLEVFDIPQFSSLDDCFNASYVIEQSGIEKVGYIKLGYLLAPMSAKKPGANQKYGENHGKMGVMLGLLKMNPKEDLPLKQGHKISFSPTFFGRSYNNLDDETKGKLIPKIILRSKLMQNFFLRGRQETLLEADMKQLLSESTFRRRYSNVKRILEVINTALDNEL